MRRKYGTALTMDVFTPTKGAKAVGVIIVVSGGFISAHDAISPIFIQPLIDAAIPSSRSFMAVSRDIQCQRSSKI